MRYVPNPICRAAALLALLAGLAAPAAHAQSASDREAVLAVNAEFYRAFRESDMSAMRELWGRKEPIGLQHPAWPRPLMGRARVLLSWTHILRSPPRIECDIEAVFSRGERWAVVCNEILDPGNIRMINLFGREDGEWKLIYHGRAPEGSST